MNSSSDDSSDENSFNDDDDYIANLEKNQNPIIRCVGNLREIRIKKIPKNIHVDLFQDYRNIQIILSKFPELFTDSINDCYKIFHHFCLTYSNPDVKPFLREFSKIGVTSCSDENGNSSLYYAIENKVNGLQLVYEMVYNHFIDIEIAKKTNKLGHSILCKCINLKNIPILKLLLSFGFDPFGICQDCKNTDKDILKRKKCFFYPNQKKKN
ncbi:hypothetical protein ACTFIR_010004 [Dictyostelium discoideum]